MREPILKIENLYYKYGNEKYALEDVSTEIFQGEKVAVIGSNGSGKSTFFLNINGVLHPERGRIIFRGSAINKKNIKELRKNIGIVFQDADNQIISSTVKSEVAFGPINLKLPKEIVLQRVEEALNTMNIWDLRDRPPHYLSGGEKKRVSIADILAMQPEVFIFDEPTVALDPLNVAMLKDLLEKLSATGRTIMISTHDVDFAYSLAERILVFSRGRIIADGTPQNIFEDTGILTEANLKKPILLELYEILVEKKKLEKGKVYPKSIEELQSIL